MTQQVTENRPNTAPGELPLQVLIVGAGPTGLTLATVLAKYGVRFRIIDKKEGLSLYTKATNIMQRNQEVLYALGLLDPLNVISGFCRRLMIHGYGKSFGPRTMHLNETPFHDVILCGQHNFERVMADALSNSGAEVEFNTALTGLEQTEGQGVVVTLQTPTGAQTLKSDYVIGCDGATGVTRTFTRYNFEPKKTGVAIRQVDCKLSWRRLSTPDQLWLFYFQNGFASIIPLPGGVHRILTIEPKKLMPERNPTLAEMQAKLREVTDDDSVTLSEPDWFSYTDLSMGIAAGLRDGRVILAGDVGNPILPNGGQGMNTGISDAFNLGWKLTALLNHGASDELLDTYGQERHSLRSTLQKTQYASLKYTTLVTPKWMQMLFRWLADPLLNRGGEYKMAQAFSELTINTRKSSLSLDTLNKKGVRAGDRVLDADVVAGAQSVRLFEVLYAKGGWTLLAFTGTNKADSRAMLKALPTFNHKGLTRYVVAASSEIDTSIPVLYDLDEVAHRTYAVTKPTLYLVRPDGYVGARVSLQEVQQLQHYADKWITQELLAFNTSVLAQKAQQE